MSNSFVNLWTVACQALLFMGLSQQEYWSGLPFPPPGYCPDQGIKPASPALQADSSQLSHWGTLHWGFSSVQSLSRVWLFATPWTAALQASLSITNSWNLVKPMLIGSVISSNHLILCPPLLLPSIFPASGPFMSQFFTSGGPSIGVSASASVLPMNIQTDFL